MLEVAIVGGGLAGVELAHQLALHEIKTTIFEARLLDKPDNLGLPHKTKMLAELVCSNSFRGTKLLSASGLLKEELKYLNSIVMQFALETSIPAGGSLSVDRKLFSSKITAYIENNSYIELKAKDIKDPEELLEKYKFVVVATGPSLTQNIKPWFEKVFNDNLYFYDAIAPIVDIDSLDMSICFWGDRNSDEQSYLNAPFTKEEYYNFVDALIKAKKVPLHSDDEAKFFVGCMPIEQLAESGPDTLRFSSMRGDGLINPNTGKTPYAVVQLRADGFNTKAYGLVGFQTRLLYGEQERVFKMIPGFKDLEILKHGSMHRNTYINAPKELNDDMSLIKNNRIFLAGQITGVEGYIESTAHGLIVANEIIKRIIDNKLYEILQKKQSSLPLNFPEYTAIGALKQHLRVERKNFQPSKINFGLIPPLDKEFKLKVPKGMKKKLAYREAISKRALEFYKTRS